MANRDQTLKDLAAETWRAGLAPIVNGHSYDHLVLALIPALLHRLVSIGVATNSRDVEMLSTLALKWDCALDHPPQDRGLISELISSEIPAKGVAAVQLDETTIRVIRRDEMIDGEMQSTLEECLLGDRTFKRTHRGVP
jgi:hypothetical protein